MDISEVMSMFTKGTSKSVDPRRIDPGANSLPGISLGDLFTTSPGRQHCHCRWTVGEL